MEQIMEEYIVVAVKYGVHKSIRAKYNTLKEAKDKIQRLDKRKNPYFKYLIVRSTDYEAYDGTQPGLE